MSQHQIRVANNQNLINTFFLQIILFHYLCLCSADDFPKCHTLIHKLNLLKKDIRMHDKIIYLYVLFELKHLFSLKTCLFSL